MIETLIYILIGWMIMQIVLGVTSAVHQIDDVKEEDKEEIEDHLKKNAVTIVKIKMEHINGWWYGFYPTKQGGELFVAQGTTYDEAIENCRQRLESDILKNKTRLVFQKNETSTV